MQKIIKRYSNENCVACVFYPSVSLGRIFATLITISCPHRPKNSGKSPQFERSRTLSQANLIIIFLILCVILTSVLEAWNLNARDKPFLMILIEIIVYLALVVVLMCINAFSDVRIKELNGLVCIIEYGRDCGLDADEITKILYKFFIMFSIFVVTEMLNFCAYYNISFSWSIVFRSIIREMCFYTQVIYTLNTTVLCDVYTVLFKKCFAKVRTVLIGAGGEVDIAGSISDYVRKLKSLDRVGDDDDELQKSLQQMRKLYASLFHNYRLSSQFCSPQFTYWWVVLILLLVANIYFFATLITDGDSTYYFHVVYHGKALGAICGATFYISTYQQVADVGEDIMSFLFRYPISKLSLSEAAQVEMMITTLHLQKPVLRASDVFTVGTKLLASISGTVVTYVLVALQFHASWIKGQEGKT